MKKIFFALLIVIIGIAIVVPLIFGKDVLEYLSSFAMIVSTLAAVLTAVIAILLYDRFSAEKELLAKQFDNVSKLIENLRIIGARIAVEDANREQRLVDAIFAFAMKGRFSELPDSRKDFLDYPVVFCVGAYSKMISILDGVSSLYLPKDIYKACKNLMFPKEEAKRQLGGYSRIQVFLPMKGDYSSKSCKVDHRAPRGHTLRTFVECLDELYGTIESWLRKHTIEVVDVRGFDHLDLVVQMDDYAPKRITPEMGVPFDIAAERVIIVRHDKDIIVKTIRDDIRLSSFLYSADK